MRKSVVSLCVTLLAVSLGVLATTQARGAGPAAVTPIRAAFYYPWYPETENWASHYTPLLGHYDSSNPSVLATHVTEAKYAGLDAFIASYWGQGTKTAGRLPLLLDAARAQGFHVAPYYEPEGQGSPPSSSVLKSDFDALAAEASGDPAWLTVGGKPVLFTYNTAPEDTCAAVARLKAASAGRFYLDMKVFAGYQSCSTQPDSWHQYGPAVSTDRQGSYSYAVSPGFFKFNEKSSRLARNLPRFQANLASQVASGAQWQLVTTWNEWGEGTSVEPSTSWESASGMGTYLDAMRAAYTGQSPPTTSPSTTRPTTSPVPTTPVPTTTRSSSVPTTTVPPTTAPTTTTPTTTTPTTTTPTTTTTPPTTTTAPPSGKVSKVLTFVEENHSLAQMKAGMPYVYSLSQRFAYASNYTAITHPSEPNYLAIAGGSTFGDTADHNPAFQVSGQSVFGQAIAAGRTAKSYMESATANCQQTNTGRYVVKHNPWASFKDERTACMANDVPSGTPTSGALATDIKNGTLPNAGIVTPNLDHDAHDGTLAAADTWMKGWLPPILASPDFTSGRLTVVITADEDDKKSGNVVLTTVLHQSLDGKHLVVSTPLTHYSLTRLYGQVDGTPPLGAAATAPDMRAAFNLP